MQGWVNKSLQQNLLAYHPYGEQQQYIDIQDQLENPDTDMRNKSQDTNPYKRMATRSQLSRASQKYEGQRTERCTGSQVSDRSASGKDGSAHAK